MATQIRLMNLKELTRHIEELPQPEFVKFSEWFDVYREASGLIGDSSEIADAQQQELRRRQAEYLADRSAGTDWDDGFFDRLRQRLADARAQKTQAC